MQRKHTPKHRRLFRRVKKLFVKADHDDDDTPIEINSGNEDNQRHLAELKRELIDACLAPEELVCPILQEVTDDMVVTPYGHIFNREAVTTWLHREDICPLTRKPLNTRDLTSCQKLNVLIKNYMTNHQQLVTAIKMMKLYDETEMRERIAAFNIWVSELNGEVKLLRQFIIQQALIVDLKNKLRLNANDPEHLEYWHEKCNKKLDNFIVVDYVSDMGGRAQYRVPVEIWDMMQLANNEFQTKDEFKRVMDDRRRQGCAVPRFFDRPFANVASRFRPSPGKVICDAEDLERLRLT